MGKMFMAIWIIGMTAAFTPASNPPIENAGTILVIIPALNESATLASVVAELRQIGLRRIRVVDNGSADDTVEQAQRAGAEVLREPKKGYGSACGRGLQSLPNDIQWILFCDADGSDDIRDIPRMLSAAGDADFVLGNRRATAEGKSALTTAQNLGNALATTLIRWAWGHSYQDLGPLRLVRRTALERMAMRDRGFGWTIEMQVRAIELGLRIAELPVNYRPRQGGCSKISGTITGSIKAGTVILMTLAQLALCRQPSWKTILAAILLLAGVVMAMPYGEMGRVGNVPPFLWGMGLMGAGFLVGLRAVSIPPVVFWTVALGTRLILLPMSPGADIYRYIWEGYIQNHGVDPYQSKPNAPELEGLRNETWLHVEQKGIPAIYPPLAQIGFRALSAFSLSVTWFKAAFLLADAATMWLLARRFGMLRTILYAWNPLVIYSFAGGGHYDSWFVFLLVGAWLLWERGSTMRGRLAAVFVIGMAVAVKWMCLPVAAWTVWRIGRERQWLRAGVAMLVCVVPFALSWFWVTGANGRVSLVPKDFALYARSAEFLPRIIAAAAPSIAWHNEMLALPLGAACLWIVVRRKDFAVVSEQCFLAILLFSPVVHPWYFTWLIPFAVFTRNAVAVAASLSAFVGFWLYHKIHLPGGEWHQSLWEMGLMWLPLLAGWWITRFHSGTCPHRPPDAQNITAGADENAPSQGCGE